MASTKRGVLSPTIGPTDPYAEAHIYYGGQTDTAIGRSVHRTRTLSSVRSHPSPSPSSPSFLIHFPFLSFDSLEMLLMARLVWLQMLNRLLLYEQMLKRDVYEEEPVMVLISPLPCITSDADCRCRCYRCITKKVCHRCRRNAERSIIVRRYALPSLI